MKDGCLSKITITESTHQAIQFKKITDALPVFCTDKGYRYINNVRCANTELLEVAFLPPYPDAAQWSNAYHQYNQKSKTKSQELAKLTTNKKLLITIIYGQCNAATKTKIVLCTTYKADHDAGNLINFLTKLRTICYKSNDGGLSYKPYKMNVVVKSLHNFSNSKPNDPNAFKEELKIKSDAILAIVGKFPDGT